ncbi:MAG: M81 family metallopeptidase [Dehalococcoidia bacterium]|nr:M81 family metallopeptidase [Dehalococcoidia bacterium]
MHKRRLPMLSTILLLVPIVIGCGQLCQSPQAVLKEKKVIAVAQIQQETNVFSPVKTTLLDFEALELYYGNEILTLNQKDELGGFLEAVADFGNGNIEVIPIIKARAVSGGPIERDIYERFKKELLQGLRECHKLDGIYLALHGSMGVDGLNDPEGDLLQAIRDELGDGVPIGVSFDLHANVTQRRAQLVTFIIGYKTNPHRDQFETGYSAGEILIKTVNGEVNPTMAFRKMRLLKGGGMNIDFLSPMRQIFKRMQEMERSRGVLSVSNFMVHIWLDEPELGWSTVAVTDNNPSLAEKLADEIAELDWSVRDVKHPEPITPSEAIRLARDSWFARQFGTTVICDVSDAVGAGAPGENTWILRALIEEGSDLVSYIPVKDPEAAQEAFKVPLNETITLTVGGKLDKIYNRSVQVTGQVIHKRKWLYGKTVILKNKGVHLILTEMPVPAMHPDFYNDLGLSLWKADIVVVKNLFPFRIWYLLYNRETINVATPGVTNINVFDLNYQAITRPIYPLDKVDSWRW